MVRLRELELFVENRAHICKGNTSLMVHGARRCRSPPLFSHAFITKREIWFKGLNGR